MIRRIAFCVFMIFGALSPAACNMSAQAQGPTTWIDQPLDGMHFPLGTIILQAHASDANGVSAIKFYVGESLLQTVSAGGARLGEAMIEWTPPGPGTYLIGASAVDSQGSSGSKAIAQISVGELSITVTPTLPLEVGITVTPTSTPMLIITPSPTATPASSGPSFTLDKNANCREGPGTAYDADETLLKGEIVPIQGRNPNNSWLWVTKPGSSRNCWVSVVTGRITGDINTVQYADAPPPPKTDPGKPDTGDSGDTVLVQPGLLLADLNPPTISNVSISPASIQQKGCGDQTLTVSATVTDDSSGVAQVTYEIRGPGNKDQGDGYLLPAGGDYKQSSFSAVIGPIAGSAGNWSLTLHALDMANNATGAGPWTFSVICIQ